MNIEQKIEFGAKLLLWAEKNDWQKPNKHSFDYKNANQWICISKYDKDGDYIRLTTKELVGLFIKKHKS